MTRYGPSRWRTITEAHGLASDNLTGGLLLAVAGVWSFRRDWSAKTGGEGAR